MDMDAPIDVTIGPYETYEDELFGYKAGFEAYITLKDDAESGKLKKFSQYLQEIENNLPIDRSIATQSWVLRRQCRRFDALLPSPSCTLIDHAHWRRRTQLWVAILRIDGEIVFDFLKVLAELS